MEDALDNINNALDKMLEILDLPLETPTWISLEMTLDSIGLDMAKVKENMFEFIISLLGTTIQDGGMRERSDGKGVDFFFNQQFIMWGMIAVCSNSLVATIH